jgi:hypothetical protein
VYRPLVYKPLPPGAELVTRGGKRFARWADRRGRARTAPVGIPSATNADGSPRKSTRHAGELRIVVKSAVYVAAYRDAAGLHTVSTLCRDEDTARGVLHDLERRSELVKGKLLTASEARTTDHQATALGGHIAAYDEHLRVHVSAKNGFAATPATRLNRRLHLERVATALGWVKLADLDRARLETWLAERGERTPTAAGMAARTRNGYAVSWSAFANWCVDTHRLTVNPFARLANANERADCRRQRRALTEGEMLRLLDATRRRPLAEHGRTWLKRPPADGPRKPGPLTYVRVTPENIAACEATARKRLAQKYPERVAEAAAAGRARALVYKTLALTGLRLREARSLTIGCAELGGAAPFARLAAEHEKARRGADIPVRADLARDLSRHVAERLRAAQRAARAAGEPLLTRLPAGAPLLLVPVDAIRSLDRDLRAADLPKRDERDRTFDMHAFRGTFNTWLAAAGVPLTTRRLLMRHAAEGVTDGHYADAKLIDLRGALELLPLLPLTGEPGGERSAATGTDDAAPVCMSVCFPAGDSCAAEATAGVGAESDAAAHAAVSSGPTVGNGLFSASGVKAGERDRTANVQLGSPAARDRQNRRSPCLATRYHGFGTFANCRVSSRSDAF